MARNYPVGGSQDPYWHRLVVKHKARHIAALADAKLYPTEAVWFETKNFGWILSARDERGVRRVLEKY